MTGDATVSGNLTVSGTGTFTGLKKTSARWLKTDIRPLLVDEARSAVMSWQAREFDWIATGEHEWGFIADEVGAFFSTPKLDAIDVDRMFAATIPVIQDHELRIAELERENAALRRELEEVRNGMG